MKTAHSPLSRAYTRGEFGHKRPAVKRLAVRADRRYWTTDRALASVRSDGSDFAAHSAAD